MSVYLHFCPLNACIGRLFFVSCTLYQPFVVLIHALRLFSWRRCYATPAFCACLSRRCSRSFVCFQTDMLWFVNDRLNIYRWPAQVKIFQADLGGAVPFTPSSIQLGCYIYSCTFWVAWLSGGLINNEISNRSIPFVPRVVRTPNMYTDKY